MWRSCTWHAHLLKNLNPALPCFGSKFRIQIIQLVLSKSSIKVQKFNSGQHRVWCEVPPQDGKYIYSYIVHCRNHTRALQHLSLHLSCTHAEACESIVLINHHNYLHWPWMLLQKKWRDLVELLQDLHIHPLRASATSQQLFHFQGWSPVWMSSFQPLSFFSFHNRATCLPSRKKGIWHHNIWIGRKCGITLLTLQRRFKASSPLPALIKCHLNVSGPDWVTHVGRTPRIDTKLSV